MCLPISGTLVSQGLGFGLSVRQGRGSFGLFGGVVVSAPLPLNQSNPTEGYGDAGYEGRK